MFFLVALIGCDSNESVQKVESDKVELNSIMQFSGNYVSSDYDRKDQGYDWSAVTVKPLNDSTLQITIRSRADIKKPSCTFDSEAKQVGTSSFKSVIEGRSVLFIFGKESLEISPADKDDEDLLRYYCSGGGTIRGSYTKIKEPLDQKQIDHTIFSKTLSWGKMGYDLRSTMINGQHELTIRTYGLKNSEPVLTAVDGTIQNAEVGDLDKDGYAELLIYVSSSGSKKVSKLIGYSPNKGKSLSSISCSFQDERDKAENGFFGGDEFAIVENNLVRRYKLYKMHEGVLKETGKMRQFQYKLLPGESAKVLKLVKVIEF